MESRNTTDELWEEAVSQSVVTQARRRGHVTNACSQSGSKVKGQGQWSVVYADDKRKLLYCLPPKAGSTMWKRAWGLLSGAFTLHDIQHAMKILNVTENNLVHDENYARLSGIRRIRHPQNLTKEKSYFKVLVVRNPYQRLLSAYMDLIKENAPHFKQISNQIANRYRGTSSGIERAATFGEFIEHVLHEYESNTVRRGIDDHWTPIHQLCHPCEIRYDYIIKLEHHDDDVYVFMKNFFNDTFTMDEVFDRNAGPHSDRNETDIKLYYTIEQKKLQKLGEFLDFDCRLFEYDNVSRSIN